MMAHFNRIEALLGLTRVEAARAELDAEVAVLAAAGLDTAREDYGRRWRRLHAVVLVLSGEPAKAIPIARSSKRKFFSRSRQSDPPAGGQ